MKGFLGTAAALVFAFSLVTAAYSFMLSHGDLGDAATTGLVVEHARWAVEADLFDCADPTPNGATYSGTNGIGTNLVSVNGRVSDVTDYDLGFINLTLHLERNYAPGITWVTTTSTDLIWSSCDIEGDAPTYKLYKQGVSAPIYSGSAPSYSGSFSGTYWVEASDAGGTSYSKKVSV